MLLLMLPVIACVRKVVYCDYCGKEIKLPANSKITEDWIIYCEECEAEFGPAVDPEG